MQGAASEVVESGGFCPVFVTVCEIPAMGKSSLHRAAPWLCWEHIHLAARGASWGAADGGEPGIKNIPPKPQSKPWLFPYSYLDSTYWNNISWAFLPPPHCCFLQVPPSPLQCPLFTSHPQIAGKYRLKTLSSHGATADEPAAPRWFLCLPFLPSPAPPELPVPGIANAVNYCQSQSAASKLI